MGSVPCGASSLVEELMHSKSEGKTENSWCTQRHFRTYSRKEPLKKAALEWFFPKKVVYGYDFQEDLNLNVKYKKPNNVNQSAVSS